MNTAIDVRGCDVYDVVELLEREGIACRPGSYCVYVYSEDAVLAESIIRDAGYYCLLLQMYGKLNIIYKLEPIEALFFFVFQNFSN